MPTLSVVAIQFYKAQLSPRKGFCCAHNRLHKLGSCSDFGLRAFRRYSFKISAWLMVRRFMQCRSAAVQLGQINENTNPDRSKPLACFDAGSACCVLGV